MPMTRIVLPSNDSGDLSAAFAALRTEHSLPQEYPADAVAEALEAIKTHEMPTRDDTAVPFFTIDPIGSQDLDQAMHLETEGDGFHVRYAIADVPSFVRPGGVLDAETRRRGETIYMPDMRIPLHPRELSEGAASLLPGQVCSAFVWDMHLDARGEVTSAQLYRAQVKSVDRLDYDGVQASADTGADPRLQLLQRIGELRAALEIERGGASLPMPEQEVSTNADGSYAVRFRPPVPSEDWNAQISLMTGMVAAKIMLDGGIGILRTMPKAADADVARFRRQAKALGVIWPADESYGAFLRRLDRNNHQHLCLIHEAVSLFRGAGYTPFDGAAPEQIEQAAVAAPYAHVTAPLRRLVDRFGLVICEALSNGQPVPDWARQALPQLPDIMKSADQLASKVDRESIDRVEAAALASLVGQTMTAFIVEAPEGGHGRPVIQLTDHAVVSSVMVPEGMTPPAAGDACIVRLADADIMTGKTTFELVAPAAG